MKKQIVFAFSLFVLPVFMATADTQGALSHTDVAAKLRELQPLPKVHYSFPFPRTLIEDPDSRLLYECARIMNSVSVSGEWATLDQVRTAVYTCARINKAGPAIPLTIGINYSPFHRELDRQAPPTDRGPTYQKELDRFESRLRTLKGWIDNANAYYKSSVSVGALLLDMERFHYQAGNDVWNEGMREALDTIHTKAVALFPDARIEWYGRGMTWGSTDPPWRRSRYFTGKEILTSLSCSLYCVPELERTLELYRRTVRLADEMGVADVTPWISLASGYRRSLKRTFTYNLDWDYDVIYSFLIGQYINHAWFGRPERAERFAPFNRARVVVFYPAPFDSRSPHWGKHFIAYVRGATLPVTGGADLSDLGHKE